MSSFDTNYVPTEHGDADQYDSYAIPSKIVPYQSYPISLVNENKIPIELFCYRAHLALIMSLTSMNMLTNMAYLQYRLR